MSNTIVNAIQPEEVTMALEHLLYAPAGTAWTPTVRIDVGSPPAGFSHMGAVADDSPSISVTKDFFRLTGGIPSVLQYQAVTTLAGEFGVMLHSYSPLAAYLGLGGIPPYNVPATAAQAFYAIVASSANSRTQSAVTSNANWSVNDMVISDTTAALNTTLNYAWISSVPDGTSIVLSGEGWKTLPTTGNPIVKVLYSRYALGTSQSPRFHLLGVADFLNGGQVIHDMPNVQAKGQWTETLRAGGIIDVSCTFDLFGYTITSPHSSGGEIVVGERVLFNGIRLQ